MRVCNAVESTKHTIGNYLLSCYPQNQNCIVFKKVTNENNELKLTNTCKFIFVTPRPYFAARSALIVGFSSTFFRDMSFVFGKKIILNWIQIDMIDTATQYNQGKRTHAIGMQFLFHKINHQLISFSKTHVLLINGVNSCMGSLVLASAYNI